MKKTLSTSLALVLLSGCTMMPDYLRPDFSGDAAWQDIPGYQTQAGERAAHGLSWQEFFADPALFHLIGTALEYNKDLKIAALNISEARALYRIERADIMPGVNANGSGSIAESSKESSATGQVVKSESYEANLGVASYELDLFGKLRSQNEAALNEYLSTRAAHDTVRNALIAETANAYLQLLADQELLDLTKKTLQAQQKTYDILSQAQDSGIATASDVARALTAVESARVNLHQYNRFVAQDKNALSVLLGVPYDAQNFPKSDLDSVQVPDNLSPLVPSEVLIDRPDVREAEYLLIARNADIGAARAAFFPSISLTGAYGFASESLANLFTGGAWGAWSFLPQITLPIFSGGANVANLDLAEIRKEKAIVNYERVIEIAFREVADELAARATLSEQLAAQRRLVSAAQKVYDVSYARYKSGIDDFLGVLDAQRELYAYQQAEIGIKREQLSNLVTLYKVLGGGSAPAPRAASSIDQERSTDDDKAKEVGTGQPLSLNQ